MKLSYVAFLVISFHLTCIRAMKEGTNDPNNPSSSSDDKRKIQETSSSNPKLEDEDKKNKEETTTPETETEVKVITPQLTRTYTHNSDEDVGASPIASDPKVHQYWSGEDETDVHRNPLLKKKKKTKKVKHNPTRVYWPEKYPHTGSMTPYSIFLAGIPMNLVYFSQIPKPRKVYKTSVATKSATTVSKACVAVRIWSLFRHEIRYPSKETSHGMRTRLKNLKESIMLKLYEKKELLQKEVIINMKNFLKLLHKWDVTEKLSKGVVHVSNEELNKKKTKKDKEKELEKLTLEERSTREKKRKGDDEKIDDAKALTPEGLESITKTGKRYLKRFKRLLKKSTRESRLFKFTDCQRTRASATYFYAAIYGMPDPEDHGWHAAIETGEEGKDPLLKYDALCGHWKRNYKKSDLNAYHLESFVDGPVIKDALNGIRKNILDFPEKSISFSDGKLFYETCAFEKAWNRKYLPWCMLMLNVYETQAIFEYLEDFEFFKNDGPDNEVNMKVGCFLFKDMIKRLIGTVRKDDKGNITWDLQETDDEIDVEDVIIDIDESPSKELSDEVDQLEEILVDTGKADETEPSSKEKIDKTDSPGAEPEDTEADTETPKQTDQNEKKPDEKSKTKEKTVKRATFYFTHLTAVLKFITHLNLDIRDTDVLRADNYYEMRERKWRTARIGVFGTNISIVLMKCDTSYSILVSHQERPVIIPGCPDELCPLEIFLKIYENSIFNCNYDEVCRIYKNPLFNRSIKPFQDPSPPIDLSSVSFASSFNSFNDRNIEVN